MIFDTHAHPYITFKKSPDSILENFFVDGSNQLISIGCDIDSSQKSIELSKRYPRLKATIGFHPVDVPLYENLEENIGVLEELYKKYSEYIVAIGETGLDYFWLKDITKKSNLSEETIIQIQKSYFIAQIQLAKKLKLPFIIHSRESNTQLLHILQEQKAQNYVFHCFSGNWDFAQKVLKQNPQAMFGLGGVLTFKKSLELQEVAQNLPLQNILLETDSPFLTPDPLRGKQENEPIYISYVLKKLQELRSEAPELIEQVVYENAMKFFAIKDKKKLYSITV